MQISDKSKRPYIQEINKDLSIPWFEQIQKTVILPQKSGKQVYYSIKPPDYVTALTRTADDKYIILKQYRPAVEDYTFELPSGHVEDGEAPAHAMIRELQEETGCVVRDVNLMRTLIPDTGRLENRLWAFYVNNVEVNGVLSPEENDGIEVHLVTRQKLFEMINSGQLNHALDLSVIAVAIFQKYLKI